MMRFELKKIFARRMNVTAMVLGYLLLGACVFSYIRQPSFYDEKTDTVLYGIKAIHADQKRAESQTDYITEEYVTQFIRQLQSSGVDLQSDEAYTKLIRPIGDLYYFVVNNYTGMSKKDMDLDAIRNLDVSSGADFYGQRMKKIKDYLNLDFSYGNYKEAEKSYWLKKAENTDIPFRWGAMCVMDIVWELIELGFYLLFVVVICASSVFSSEYESGAAPLLLTTKYGKDRLVYAKIAVSVLFAIVYLSAGVLLSVGAVGVFVGFYGANLPVQLHDSVIPFHFTMGQVCVLTFAIILLVALALTLVLLCCSAGFKSSLVTLVIGMAAMIAPVFFPMSKTSGLWNHINSLFPVRAVEQKKMLGSFISYTVGNFVIPYDGMLVAVYTLIAVAALLLIRRGFVHGKG